MQKRNTRIDRKWIFFMREWRKERKREEGLPDISTSKNDQSHPTPHFEPNIVNSFFSFLFTLLRVRVRASARKKMVLLFLFFYFLWQGYITRPKRPVTRNQMQEALTESASHSYWRTDGRKDTPFYRDALPHLKNISERIKRSHLTDESRTGSAR